MSSKLKALVTEARWRGFWGTVRALKTHKMGTMNCFIGEDEFNNKFFEDKKQTYGRHRWVEYGDRWNPDSLKITPEWHAWLHHNIDTPPTENPLPSPAYKKEAHGNRTGTSDAYVPTNHRLNHNFHGAASEKYESWKPSNNSNNNNDKKPTPDVDVLDLK